MPMDADTRSNPTLAERIIQGMSKASLVQRHEAWRAAGSRGLTPTQAQILAVLAAEPAPIGINGVAQRMALTKAAASEAVAALVEKDLVIKTRSAEDGRAVTLRLTRRGRGAASAAAPDASPTILRALRELPQAEQEALLRGLIGLIRNLQEQGAVPVARMCVSCAHFRPLAHAGSAKPHHCAFIDAPMADADLRLECRDMEPTTDASAARLWQAHVSASRRRDHIAGEGRGPRNSRPTETAFNKGANP